MLTFPDVAFAAALAAGYSTPSETACALGISDVAARRRLHRLEALGVARRVAYRPIGGLGRKPVRYRLARGAVLAVLDLREGEKVLSYCTPPDYRFKRFLPKIYVHRPDSDKDDILLTECLPALGEVCKNGAPISLTVLTDADVPPDVSVCHAALYDFVTPYDVDAWFLNDAPSGETVAVARADDFSLSVAAVRDGKALYGETFPCAGFDVDHLAEKLSAVSSEFGASRAVIISDYIIRREKETLQSVFRDAAFFDSSVYSMTEQALRLTIHKILTGEITGNDKNTRR